MECVLFSKGAFVEKSGVERVAEKIERVAAVNIARALLR